MWTNVKRELAGKRIEISWTRGERERERLLVAPRWDIFQKLVEDVCD